MADDNPKRPPPATPRIEPTKDQLARGKPAFTIIPPPPPEKK